MDQENMVLLHGLLTSVGSIRQLLQAMLVKKLWHHQKDLNTYCGSRRLSCPFDSSKVYLLLAEKQAYYTIVRPFVKPLYSCKSESQLSHFSESQLSRGEAFKWLVLNLVDGPFLQYPPALALHVTSALRILL